MVSKQLQSTVSPLLSSLLTNSECRYNMYVESPHLDNPRFHKIFRRRFRMPFESFKALVVIAQDDPLFKRWKEGARDVAGQLAAPLPLLILCALRYLGRGWTFDDLSESTGISEEVIRVFFHAFLWFGSTTLYQAWVVAPKTAHDAATHTQDYSKAGLPGCVGSCDATHIVFEKVEYRLRQSHLGFKSSHTARTYNITVNNRQRILATTTGHPARWNDKTLVLFDGFVVSLSEGRVLNDAEFELYERSADGSIVSIKYKGAWLIVDNGYLNWPTTVPPMKSSCLRTEIRFSKWLESVRKDVECTFGILKGRFRVLKTGIRLGRQESGDRMFMTCCALHNWLLEVDGLDQRWENGVASIWEGNLGLHDINDVMEHLPVPMRRLLSPTALRRYDASSFVSSTTSTNNNNNINNSQQRRNQQLSRQERTYEREGLRTARVVKDLSLSYFRNKLVQHFDIAFKRNEVQWPGTQNRQQQPDI